jgi:hypothetical protein
MELFMEFDKLNLKILRMNKITKILLMKINPTKCYYKTIEIKLV